jgi:putative intracellular protease/amidase
LFFSKIRVGSRGESASRFWQTAKGLGGKRPLSVERFGKASVLGSQRKRRFSYEVWVVLRLVAALTRRLKVEAGCLVSVCAAAQVLVGKGRFWLAVARQGWSRRFRQSGLATATVLAVAPQVGCAGFGELGRVGGERPFGVAEVLEGRTAVGASPWPGKAGANVVGKVVR